MDTTPTHNPEPARPNHHAHYGSFAGLRGLLAALTMVPGREPTARLAAQLTGLSPQDRLVDVGCGPGSAARHAARQGSAVTGVDPAPVMLAVARLLPVRGLVTWREGTAEKLPLEDGSATVLWALSTVHHWADPQLALHEVRRVLQPGGRLLAVERHGDPEASGLASHGWSRAQADAFADQCREAGFTDVDVSTHRPGRGEVLAVRAVAP
jgi:ubiquinone/menaquinone biosynthesis C-methylase UbiE